MAVRKVMYFSAMVSNRSGEGARILAGLRKAGVSLLAFSGFPQGGRSQVDFVPRNAGAFLKAARGLKLKVGAGKTAFLTSGQDKLGALQGIVAKLAKSRINIISLTAVTAGNRFGGIFWVPKDQTAKVAKILGK